MGNVLRPARGADDERLFPAGYIESASSIHTVTITDNLVPIYDAVLTGISAINDITLIDDFPIIYDQDYLSTIHGIRLVDSLVSFNDTTAQSNISFTKVLVDSLPIIIDDLGFDIAIIYAVRLEDGLYIFADDLKTSILRSVKLEDNLISLNDIVSMAMLRNILLTDYLPMSDDSTKQLKLTFKEDMPLWMSDASTRRFHWVCVFAVSKIKNSIGITERIEDSYLIDRIEETAGGDVVDSITTTFNIGEINQLEDN